MKSRQFVGLESGASWPKPGEIVIVNVTSASPAESLVAPSVRTLALAPERYADQHVTVKGQFRGRNLYRRFAAGAAGRQCRP